MSQFEAFLAEKLFGVNPIMLDPEIRKLSQKNKSSADIIKQKVFDALTPKVIKDVSKLVKKYKGRRVRSARAVIEARRKAYTQKRGGSSEMDFILNQLSSDKSYDVGEKNLLKILESTNNKQLVDTFWGVKERSKAEKLSPFSGQSKAFLKSLWKDKSFRQAYSKVINNEDNNNLFSPSNVSPKSSRSSDLTSSLNGSNAESFFSPFSNSTTNLLEVQQATYALLKTNFKDINETLKDIKKAIDGIDTDGGGLLEGIGAVSLAKNAKSLLKKGAGAAALGLRSVGKVLKVGGSIGAPIAAGITAKANLDSIKKAEELGLFSPEQAKLLRKKVAITEGSAAAVGVGGAALGAATTGGIGTAAGGYLGYNFGEEAGAAIAEGIYGNKVDRTAGYLATVASMESSLNANPNATGTTSAKGLFQFTDGTWNNINKKYGKGYDLKGAVDPRLDPKKSADMMKLLTRENQLALESKLGKPVNDVELYAAHFLGSKGAGNLLTANPNQSAAELLPDAANANKSIFYKGDQARSVGEVKTLLATKYGNNAARLGLATNKVVPEIHSAPPIDVVPASTEPGISDDAMKSFSRAEGAKVAKDAINQERVTTTLEKISKNSSEGMQSSKQLQDTAARIRSGGRVGGGSGGSPAIGQTAMSDINSIHFTDGMLLNVLTD